MCWCFNLCGRFWKHIIRLCWSRNNNYEVFRGPGSHTKVAQFRQPFQNYYKAGSSNTSDKSSTLGPGVQPKGVKPAGPSQHHPYTEPSRGRNSSQSGGVKCFKCGEPGHKSAEYKKASGNRYKALLMEEMVEQSCEDDIPTYISPLKKKLGWHGGGRRSYTY